MRDQPIRKYRRGAPYLKRYIWRPETRVEIPQRPYVEPRGPQPSCPIELRPGYS